MFKSLFAKLTLALFLLFILLSILTISVTFFATDYYQQEVMQKLNAKVAQHIVAETGILQKGGVNRRALRKLFHSLMVLNPSLEIYLIDHEGWILEFSAPPWKVVRLSVDIEPINRYLTGQTLLPLQGDDPRDFSHSKVFSATLVPLKGKPDGYLYVILGGEQYDSIAEKIKNSYILSSSLIVTAIGLVTVFFIGTLLFANLTRRLKKLATTVNTFEKSPQERPTFPTFRQQGDEIDQLSNAFQSMSLKIYHQLDNLKTTDTLRRELVANVSHDLRTPLATLQGYIETLLIKDATLSKNERRDYLQTAIKHCARLNHLISELFELARLDASETKPNHEMFNLAELIEDSIQKFTLPSQQKGVKLTTQYESTALFVYADISLIERVLDNLLENALRFAPKGGMITLALNELDQHIQIQVCDNGSGIPDTELSLIFDRFYQLDKNRSIEDNNSGLGLAIVKRILELHNSTIKVTSLPDKETTFSFILPSHAS